jgi:hypothetical protein
LKPLGPYLIWYNSIIIVPQFDFWSTPINRRAREPFCSLVCHYRMTFILSRKPNGFLAIRFLGVPQFSNWGTMIDSPSLVFDKSIHPNLNDSLCREWAAGSSRSLLSYKG